MEEAKIKGVICTVIFENEDNGFKICDLDCDGEIFTVKGLLPYVHPGETIEATGKWDNTSDYGLQFNVESFETFMPQDPSDIITFLQSDLFSGIGEVTAITIAEKFGDRTAEVLKNHPEELAKIKGISEAKAEKISKTYNEYESMYELLSFLRRFGLKNSVVNKIYKKYGDDSVDVVRENPYKLYEDNIGIRFDEADKIAFSQEIPYDSSSRICAGIIFALRNFLNNEGHLFYPEEELARVVSERLDVSPETVLEDINILESEHKTVSINDPNYGNVIYLKQIHDYELFIKSKLGNLAENDYEVSDTVLEDAIKSFETDENIVMGDTQKEAVETAIRKGLLVITGGPGTGKTTIIKAIARYFGMSGMRAQVVDNFGKSKDLKLEFSAPTGRAAKRIKEASGYDAKTIHRLLEVNYDPDKTEDATDEMKFKRNEKNPLDADVLIVDESSMIDIILMYHLLKAMKYGARLILVGDKDQLPSVGPGKIIADLISDPAYPKTVLDMVYRQSSDSLIAENAYRINKGDMPKLNEKDKDFFFVRCNKPEECAKTVIDLCCERLPNAYGFSPLQDIQVISPTKQKLCGTVSLNKMLQEHLNPPGRFKDELEIKGKPDSILFRTEDRVMHIKNDYELEWENANDPLISGTGVFNGEMGIIKHIDKKKKIVTVVFDDDRLVRYDKNNLEELELCYAITVHKSQGSEFDCVVIPIMDIPQMLVSRNILYTAVTRAKKFVVLVGKPELMDRMIKNNRVQFRFTGMGIKEKTGEDFTWDEYN